MTTTKKILTPQTDIDHSNNLLVTYNQNKSMTIRTLLSQGWEKGRIARSLGIRYQFVRNVSITPIKKG